MRDDGELEVVAAANGDEMHYDPARSDAVVYGNRTLEAVTEDRLIIAVTWRVWDIDEAELLFRVRMAGEDTLLDARGDLVLVRQTDQFDVPRAVVRPLVPVMH